MDQGEVMIGTDDDERGLAMCGRVVRQPSRVSNDGETVAVPLACARWRGRQGEASGVGELVQEGR